MKGPKVADDVPLDAAAEIAVVTAAVEAEAVAESISNSADEKISDAVSDSNPENLTRERTETMNNNICLTIIVVGFRRQKTWKLLS